tara:strand:+ start:295 stop:531 length:237 start_codon:yes stop_codon:yes gene_type:complete
MKNIKEREMKTKKIVAGTYDVFINNHKYEIYQDENLFDKGWVVTFDPDNTKEAIDTCSTLSEAKEIIKYCENKNKERA